MVNREGKIWIIDWPQYTTKDHPNAEEILARDITNMVYYFHRKYNTNMTTEEGIEYVRRAAIRLASS
jgi:RIO kinase 2